MGSYFLLYGDHEVKKMSSRAHDVTFFVWAAPCNSKDVCWAGEVQIYGFSSIFPVYEWWFGRTNVGRLVCQSHFVIFLTSPTRFTQLGGSISTCLIVRVRKLIFNLMFVSAP